MTRPGLRAFDPSTQPNRFAAELSHAIEARGLTLARVRAHLEMLGLPVSVATLSYWTTGRSRPNRRKSLAIVQALEGVLKVPSGSLVDLLPTGSEDDGATCLDVDGAVLQAALAGQGLPTAREWHQLLVGHHCRVGADGTTQEVTTTLVQRALVDGPVGWCMAMEGEVDVEAEGLVGVEATRRVDGIAGLTILEFRLRAPVPRGTVVRTVHRSRLPGAGTPAVEFGYGLRRTADRLALRVVFDDVMPTDFQRRHRAPRATTEVVLDQPVLVLGPTVQAVVVAPAPGMHVVGWTW